VNSSSSKDRKSIGLVRRQDNCHKYNLPRSYILRHWSNRSTATVSHSLLFALSCHNCWQVWEFFKER